MMTLNLEHLVTIVHHRRTMGDKNDGFIFSFQNILQ
jgi:hypothetical protein